MYKYVFGYKYRNIYYKYISCYMYPNSIKKQTSVVSTYICICKCIFDLMILQTCPKREKYVWNDEK